MTLSTSTSLAAFLRFFSSSFPFFSFLSQAGEIKKRMASQPSMADAGGTKKVAVGQGKAVKKGGCC